MQAMTEAVDHLRTEVRLATESAPEWRDGFFLLALGARSNRGSPSPFRPPLSLSSRQVSDLSQKFSDEVRAFKHQQGNDGY